MTIGFKEGDFIKFKAPTGSVGIVDHIRPDVDQVYVTWCYGLDVKCEQIKSKGTARISELRKISEEEYRAVADRKAWPNDNKPAPKKKRIRVTMMIEYDSEQELPAEEIAQQDFSLKGASAIIGMAERASIVRAEEVPASAKEASR